MLMSEAPEQPGPLRFMCNLDLQRYPVLCKVSRTRFKVVQCKIKVALPSIA